MIPMPTRFSSNRNTHIRNSLRYRCRFSGTLSARLEAAANFRRKDDSRYRDSRPPLPDNPPRHHRQANVPQSRQRSNASHPPGNERRCSPTGNAVALPAFWLHINASSCALKAKSCHHRDADPNIHPRADARRFHKNAKNDEPERLQPMRLSNGIRFRLYRAVSHARIIMHVIRSSRITWQRRVRKHWNETAAAQKPDSSSV